MNLKDLMNNHSILESCRAKMVIQGIQEDS